MKRAQLFPPKKQSLTALFTEQQALANRAFYEQELESLGDKASVYFRRFFVGRKERWWLLDTEDWRDLKDTQIDFVLRHLPWFKAQIAKVKLDEEEDEIPWL